MAAEPAGARLIAWRELERLEVTHHEYRVAEIAFDGCWFRVPPRPARSLERRSNLRRILAALVRLHARDPSLGLDVPAAFGVGWPNERCIPAALRNRVHVAIATLRSLGLARVIVFDRGRYRLAPEFDIRCIRVLAAEFPER